jgi:hypothetical protein
MYRNNYATVEESIKRMQGLMGNTNPVTPSISQPFGNIEKVYRGVDGNSYAIIKENSKYYLKISAKDRDLKLEDFEYLGGNRQCKGLYEYRSYNQAEKVLKEELTTLAQNINNKELVVEERQRIDNNLAQTVTTKEMRGEIDRIREIMENANKIVTSGSTSVERKVGKPLTEQVKIGDKEEGVLTDSVNEGDVNEVLGVGSAIGGIAKGVGSAVGGIAQGAGNIASSAVDAVGDTASSAVDAVGDTASGIVSGRQDESGEEEISLDDEEIFGDEEEEIDLDDEFDVDEEEGEFESEEHMDDEMDLLHALMDKLNSIEEKLDGEGIEEPGEDILDDESEVIDLDLEECGLSEGHLSPKLNQKYNVLPLQADEHRRNFEKSIMSWLRNQEQYMDSEQLAAAMKAKIDEIIAEEEAEDLENDSLPIPPRALSGFGDKNFRETVDRIVTQVLKETINTVASDVTKEKFGYDAAQPDSEGRTSFEDVSAEGEIGLGNHHQDTLDKVNSTVGRHSGNNSPKDFSAVEIEIVGEDKTKNESKARKLYIVEHDGTVVGQIPRESLKRKK